MTIGAIALAKLAQIAEAIIAAPASLIAIPAPLMERATDDPRRADQA